LIPKAAETTPAAIRTAFFSSLMLDVTLLLYGRSENERSDGDSAADYRLG
jgi:hypothetical protein